MGGGVFAGLEEDIVCSRPHSKCKEEVRSESPNTIHFLDSTSAAKQDTFDRRPAS